MAVSVSCDALAQQFSVHRKNQMFLGFAGGINLTLPHVTEKYHVLVPTTESAGNGMDKKYGKLFQNIGSQFGLHFTYCLTANFSIVAQPGYRTHQFKYSTSYKWADTVENMNFEREFHHSQKLSYFTLPVLFRWDITTNQFSPFVQAGIFTDFRHQAQKQIGYDYTADGEENESQLNSSTRAPVTDHINKFNLGVVGGAGIAYYTKYVVVGFEAHFRYGFLPVINNRNRYADYTGFTAQYLDVFDQMTLSNLDFQFSVKLPITKAQTLNILRRKKY